MSVCYKCSDSRVMGAYKQRTRASVRTANNERVTVSGGHMSCPWIDIRGIQNLGEIKLGERMGWDGLD
jgi:hypothetical protein